MAPPFPIEKRAVAYLRTIPTINLRNNPNIPDPGLQLEDIQIDSHLRSYEKFIHLGVTDTRDPGKRQFELKLYAISDEVDEERTPSLSPASEDAVTLPSEIASKSYNAKRQVEIKAYLRYIKSGHETIKQLEAFHQYRNERGKLTLAQYFKFCDVGNVKQLRRAYVLQRSRLPEAFIWKLYHKIIDALAFLHNDHPKYDNDPLHKGRKSIIVPDLDAENVYLCWPEGGSHSLVYPDIKLGDFDTVNFVDFEGGFLEEDITGIDYRHNPPELNWWSAKSDIWRAGSIVYSLVSQLRTTTKLAIPNGKTFTDLTEEDQRRITMDPRRVQPIDHMYSGEFEAMLQRSLVLDYKERPSARELLQELEGPATERALNSDLFRALPGWIVDDAIPGKDNKFTEEHTFSQERLKQLLQPGALEAEKVVQKKKLAAEKQAIIDEDKRVAARAEMVRDNPSAFDRFYGDWLPRELEDGNLTDRDFPLDEYAEEAIAFVMVRRRGIEAGTWIDPGPTWQEIKKLDQEAKDAAAAPPP
ncbi:hypothetical protein BcDW1_2131 [Botrytis cinerea BcDW1]|uniref:non-specific serine/threonine protein kinase n=2 Tax=Botryotinia fuckeliana TaxID=40559 RepID=G2Y8G1_BOTF4|nr:hypothetical protein BcDW1_2131 [Botrytis cinerea BcDW1]CCD34069.1 hypothetical protein BofuT4_P106080.1 [Botrytis cinerea T4]